MSTLTNTVAPENGASVTDTTFYPVPVFHFKVTIGDHEGVFTEVSGLNASVDVIEYRHGMSKGQVYKMPGITNLEDVTLKKEYLRQTYIFTNGSQLPICKLPNEEISPFRC